MSDTCVCSDVSVLYFGIVVGVILLLGLWGFGHLSWRILRDQPSDTRTWRVLRPFVALSMLLIGAVVFLALWGILARLTPID